LMFCLLDFQLLVQLGISCLINTGNPPILDTLFTLQNAQNIQTCVFLEFFHSQNIINTLH